MNVRWEIKDLNGLGAAIDRWVAFDTVVAPEICRDNLTEIYNRGKGGGTPVLTGELRISLTNTGDEVGYVKDYAPHVEYGHRTVNGGYVEGQHYLENNVNEQRPIFERQILEVLKQR